MPSGLSLPRLELRAHSIEPLWQTAVFEANLGDLYLALGSGVNVERTSNQEGGGGGKMDHIVPIFLRLVSYI